MGGILTRNRESRDYPRFLRSVLMIRCRNICCKCNAQFNAKVDLDEHMQRVHAQAFYICDYCSFISRIWSTFEQHIHVFHNDIVFCSYCYKAFSDYSSLLLHWKTHGKRRYLCPCGQFLWIEYIVKICVCTQNRSSARYATIRSLHYQV